MPNPVVFRRNTNVGAADAESDDLYLTNCFLDTGDLEALLSCDDPKCIVLGRTGAGKTALLKEVAKRAGNCSELAPEALSLSYITNSEVLRFFETAGVDLDVFYSLLWRHILTVELLRMRYNITNEVKQGEFLERLRTMISRDVPKQRALKYLSDWGSRFWEETEYRTKEFTRKLETDLKASTKVGNSSASLGAEGARKLSQEEKIEVIDHGRKVVSEVQIKELHDVISLLAENIFDDPQKKYYIVIDRLDEDWVPDDRIRLKLIKALIETIRTFRRVRSVKIIIALRTDLHERVLRGTESSGFQDEKYRALYLPLRWTRPQIVQLLNDRVRFMFKRQYTNQSGQLQDVLPSNQIDKRTAAEYIVDRTFFRPREAILFLNECLAKSEGASRITIQILRQAEVTYSQQRLTSLADEWRQDYPNLAHASKLLEHRKTPFTVEGLTHGELEAVAAHVIERAKTKDIITKAAEQFFYNDSNHVSFAECLVRVFYQVGLIGVKPDPHLGRQWSYLDQPTLEQGQVKSTSQIDIHKTFWAVLGASRTP